MANITSKDEAVRLCYEAAEPIHLGNLHERMKYLLACARKCKLNDHDQETWQALWDMVLEVSYHEPGNPPFGKRHRHRRRPSHATTT